MSPFPNPAISVATFRLRGWCILGVFLLPAFTCLGHECQDLLSSCDGMHVCTDQPSVYTLIRKSFGGMESEPMLTPSKKSPLPEKNSPNQSSDSSVLTSSRTKELSNVFLRKHRPLYSRVPDQNDASQAWYLVQICHSGPEPSDYDILNWC